MSQVRSIVWPRTSPLATDAFLVILSSVAIGLLGQVAIPLWFTPVPLATRAQFILLLAGLLGPRRASLAVVAFLAQGAMGLPVFTGGGSLMGPTGGYLIGYLAAAYLTGHLLERMKEANLLQTFFRMALGNGLIFLMGWGYLSVFVGVEKGFLLGVLPFLLGDALKLIFVAKIFHAMRGRGA